MDQIRNEVLSRVYLGEICKQNLTRATSQNIPHAPGLGMRTVFLKNLRLKWLEAELLDGQNACGEKVLVRIGT